MPELDVSRTARVEPVGLEIRVVPGETLFDAAWREGYAWPTICFGQAVCTHCHVRLREGAEHVPPSIEKDERLAIQRIARRLYKGDTTGIRLACRLRIEGDVVLEQNTFKGERHRDA